MAPKKAVAVAETSMSPTKEPEKELKGGSKVASEETSKPVKKVPAHPPALDMVKEALKELDQRKGVSAQAVRSYIKEKYTTVDEERVKSLVRKALSKGIESGVFVRPANSNTMTGAQGRFRLAVRKPAKKSKVAKENSDPNAGKAKDATAGGSTKTKSVTEGAKPKKVKNDSAASKIAPAKKPKAKRPADTEDVDPESVAKSQKTSKKAPKKDEPEKSPAKKGGKKAVKAPDGDVEVAAPKKGGKKSEDAGQEVAVTAPKKRGRKAAQKAVDGEETASAAPKAAGKRGKKTAEK